MKSREINYLGALLHDIGKFAWRAQPYKKGDSHEKLGEEFIRQYLGKCQILRNNIEDVIKAANRQIGKVWIADVISAQERQDEDLRETRRPIISIFNRVNINKAEIPKSYFFYYPEPLRAQMSFPEKSNQNTDEFLVNEQYIISKHEMSWKEFIKEIENLNNIKDFKAFINTFYSLLEKYTAKVCSAGYKSLPDISLFDHSRIVCALSICYEETDSKDEECLLVMGDISGIQNYIYKDIHMKENAAKRLRGRSLFINLLSETIANYILNETNLYLPNIIYNGGGHFILILPNNKSNREKIIELEKSINKSLFEKFGGELQLILSSLLFSAKELITNYGNCYKKLNEINNINKSKKSYSILEEKLINTINIYSYMDSNAELENTEEDLGQALPNSDYIIEIHLSDNKINLNNQKKTAHLDFSQFKSIWILPSDKENLTEIKSILSDFKNQPINAIVIHKINDTNFMDLHKDLEEYNFPISYRFKFIGSYIPKVENRPMTFEEISKIDTREYPLLAVARMDVDSLGAIFAFGLSESDENEKKFTISRIANLSRELNHFFCGHINSIAEKYKVYIAYSGGDDVFVIGSWLKVLDFVQELREEFRKFVCYNNNITISCGITITKSNFPISKSAILAGELESRAKKADIDKKDHVSVFDTEVKWEKLQELRNMANKILEIIVSENLPESKKIPRSFVHSILAMTRKCFDDKGKLKLNIVQRVNTRLHYAFARRGVDAKEIEEKTKGYKTILAEYLLKSKDKENFYKNFIIPASIVLYKTRN